MDELDFDSLELIRLPIKIKGVVKYYLQEADEASTAAWENKRLTSARFSGGTFIGHGPMADGRKFLLSRCLYDLTDKLVPESLLNSWPAKVVDPLFEKLKEISGLNAVDTVQSLEQQIQQLTEKLDKLKQAREPDPEKNGQPGGPSTST